MRPADSMYRRTGGIGHVLSGIPFNQAAGTNNVRTFSIRAANPAGDTRRVYNAGTGAGAELDRGQPDHGGE